jgi:hypothetical protein
VTRRTSGVRLRNIATLKKQAHLADIEREVAVLIGFAARRLADKP